MAFTTTSKAPRRLDRKEQHRQTVARARARGRDLRGAMEGEGVIFYTAGKSAGLPKVADPARKKACGKSLALFATTYLPRVFTMPMSDGQRADMDTMQKAITTGGRYAFAAPRGDGKTSRVEAAILWAGLYGHRRCIVVVGADLTAAQEIVESVKIELRTNERLRADFPIPCWAAALSDDTALKAKGWTWNGTSLCMRWGRGGLVLPVLDDADGSGCAMVPRGLTGRLRGMRLKVGKKAVRPDLYAIDDPQTDESAASNAQVDTRENLILGAIMGSGGPAATITAMMPCTIIKHNDLAYRMLDRKRHPDWQGSIRGLVTTWPTTQDTLWKEYAMKRKTESQESANAFYREHQTDMDAGAVLDWPERFTKGKEISAIQHAENLVIDLGEDVFSAEYQNAPKEKQASIYELSADIVASRIHPGRHRGDVPQEGRLIVSATDLNHYGLHSVVAGFANDQTGWVLAYGRHDKEGAGIVPQNCPESEAKRRMFEALVVHGGELASVNLIRNGQAVRPGLWVIDGGYMPDVVKRYIEGPGRTLGIPTIAARGYSADRYRPTPKNCIGAPRENCHLTESPIAGRFLAFNADAWREVSQRAWLASPNAPGSLSLFEGRHTEFAGQVTRERLVEKLHGQYGPVWRWVTAPGWHDYGDALTMCFVGAAWGGIGTTGEHIVRRARPAPRRQCRVPLSEDASCGTGINDFSPRNTRRR
ncbi:MAG: hypothetical protein A2498_00885 [Lentisphaerae bacterium RIFOXYC12_FULL_60_16]|nr:MAG: hypothetical protein A2498_00885 [Lentisphaerae bacterium RIFOXYC12_FULL_60_16]